MAPKPIPLTNQEFADAIGCHHSMASRIRGGKRLPGLPLVESMSKVYGIPVNRLLAARKKGEEAFGEFVTKQIFDKGLRPTSA